MNHFDDFVDDNDVCASVISFASKLLVVEWVG